MVWIGAGQQLDSGLIDPEEDNRGKAYGGHEGLLAAIIADGDAVPVLESAENVLDAVHPVVRDALLAGRGPMEYAASCHGLAEAVAVIALVVDDNEGGRDPSISVRAPLWSLTDLRSAS
jgi:hypothetical protein